MRPPSSSALGIPGDRSTSIQAVLPRPGRGRPRLAVLRRTSRLSLQSALNCGCLHDKQHHHLSIYASHPAMYYHSHATRLSTFRDHPLSPLPQSNASFHRIRMERGERVQSLRANASVAGQQAVCEGAVLGPPAESCATACASWPEREREGEVPAGLPCCSAAFSRSLQCPPLAQPLPERCYKYQMVHRLSPRRVPPRTRLL